MLETDLSLTPRAPTWGRKFFQWVGPFMGGEEVWETRAGKSELDPSQVGQHQLGSEAPAPFRVGWASAGGGRVIGSSNLHT